MDALTETPRRLLLGAGAIAHYIGNARCTRTIYESARRGELPIFKLNNRLADALDDVMREKEQAALDAYGRRRRVLVAGGRR